MLILTCKLGNEIINCYDGTHDKEQLKKWASKKILLCPVCGKPYEYCHGKVKTPYFRHMDKNECEDRFSESETEEHLNGKRDLFEWIKKQNGVTNAVLEGWIPETKQRPDIMFEYGSRKYVIEYQCSPIATEYVERHELYRASGIIDIWIAGYEKYFKPNARHKYLEDYIEGYYNPTNHNYKIGLNTEQGNFVHTIKTSKNEFPLRSFSFENNSIIYRSYKNKNFKKLLNLHNERYRNRNNSYLSERNSLELKLKQLEKYVNSFYGTFSRIEYTSYTKTPFCYVYSYSIMADFNRKRFFLTEKNFYKRIYDIKKTIKSADKLFTILNKYSNKNWEFRGYINEDCEIIVNIYLLDDFHYKIQFCCDDFDLENEFSIQQLLKKGMLECLRKGMEGNTHKRIMEVKDNS